MYIYINSLPIKIFLLIMCVIKGDLMHNDLFTEDSSLFLITFYKIKKKSQMIKFKIFKSNYYFVKLI